MCVYIDVYIVGYKLAFVVRGSGANEEGIPARDGLRARGDCLCVLRSR